MQRWNELALQLLAQAEEHFGPRDASWAFGGVTFVRDGPKMLNDASSKRAVIGIDMEAAPHENQIIYQLSHEVVHLLSPVAAATTVLVEEGMAVYFSCVAPDYPDVSYRLNAWRYLDRNPGATDYRDALYAYLALRRIDGGAIKRLRAIDPAMYAWDANFLKKNVPGISGDLASLLVEHRSMR